LLAPIADADDAEGMSVEEEEVLPDEDATAGFRFFFPEVLAAAFLAAGFLSWLLGGAGGTTTVAGFTAALAFCWGCC
jgi:hypothetical protein